MSSELVFSTSGGKKKKEKKKSGKGYAKGDGPMKMRLESKGRAGKSVTVLFNLPLDESEAKTFMKKLQGVLACGATLKNSTIEFRGDLRDKVADYCGKNDIKVVRAGG